MPIDSGQRIGAYQIIEPLGAGGMGEVYRARDTRLGRFVAIKVVSPDLQADRAAAERFEREARLASSLNHPSIVTVYDIGQTDGRPFIVMELIEGQSLFSRLATGPLNIREALEIACQVADGLAAAHGASIVHRDLKPQNIMLTADGRAKIVDFGLSKMALAPGPEDETARRSRLTEAHVILGSAGYMAPEQVAGRPVDFRADQFALGAVLYEMLSGRRAFKRDTAIQTMAAIVADEPAPIIAMCPLMPPSLVTVVERCLAKDPDQRYASTRDLAQDLRDARDSIVSGSRSLPAAHPPLRRWIWPTAVAGLVLALAAIAAIAGTVPWSWRGGSAAGLGAATTPVRQVVVLPFTNLTGDGTDQFFCDGLAETLTNSLYQLQRFQPTLRVVSPSDVHKEHVVSPKEAHQAFGATLAITGSVQRSASAMRLTLALIDAVRLRQISSRVIEVAAGQEASMSNSVAIAAAALLNLKLDPAARDALTAGGTSVLRAFEYYVEGRGYLQRFDKVENVDRAIDLFEGALKADDRYALAHAALAEAYWRKYELEHQVPLIERAVDSCGAALRIDGRLAPVHVTLALIARGRGRYEEAIASAARAVELDPVSSDAYRELALAYEVSGKLADAEMTYKKAILARPDDWAAYNALGGFYLKRGQGPDAEAAFRRVTELTPDNTRGFNNLGATYFSMRRYEEAGAMWERSTSIRPNVTAASNLGTYYYDRGRYADAARAFERAVSLTANDYRIWCNLGAALYWAPGERSHASAAYEQAVRLAEQAREVNPKQADVLAQLADAYSMLGRAREARETAGALERLKPEDAGVLFLLAGVHEQVGDRAKALVWLGRAIASGYSRERIDRSPGLAELRKDERYVHPVK